MPTCRPSTIRLCSTRDGVNIAYATSGKGPPLVFVSNWFTHLEFNWKSSAWRHWNETFSRHNTLVRMDPRGCGLSDREAEPLSLDGWVCDLEAVVDALELEHFPVLGFCQGAAVAVTYAFRHPERVDRLILYGSYPRGMYAVGDPQGIKMAQSMEEMIRQGWGADTPAFQELFARLLMPEGNAEQIGWLCEQQRRSTTAAHAARYFHAFQSIDVIDIAPQVRTPALVLHQRSDAIVPFAWGQHMASLLPDARFVPLEGKNHMMLPDTPAWATFVAEVDEFLDADRESGHARDFRDLTQREYAVLDCIARGSTNQEIADALFISLKTVGNHVTHVFAKLGVSNRSQAIVRAREAGLGQSLQ